MLTVNDCLERISASKPAVILKAIAKGQLRAINISSGEVRPTWRIREEDFEEWLELREAKPMTTGRRRKPVKAEDVPQYV